MKKITAILSIAFVLVISGCMNNQSQERKITYMEYNGAWFDIEYPATFTIKGKEESNIKDKYDGVLFQNVPERVEFYVYSPQWSGESYWEEKLENEETLEENTIEEDGKKITNVFLHDLNDMYYRRYTIIQENEDTVKYLFGIKYPSEKVHDKYKEAYDHFKNSIKQYAD